MKKIDLTNKKFGRWTVLKKAGRNKSNHILWLCTCECGTQKEVLGDSLRGGKSLSCGCFSDETRRERNTKHGDSDIRLYRIWAGIKTRIFNRNRKEYHDYGGRGISICDEWANDYTLFKKWAMENGYRDDLSIDRIDVNGNYEPANCRWSDKDIQMNNQRSNNLITYNGKTMNITQWSKETGISRSTLSARFHKYKMSPEEAFRK